ncbi:MAG: DUF177 domain-containing protein [Anaeromicrobium sp.]|jgi:uncharacterized protein|uniref:YceD family protein n=1 Tax=Anaeromicrobium sp. TaxID=1929132 RepID=UPI0025E270C6|nr:DUF177 domain-containing protein [Anaeromicrobium sp.]MCT4594881.1 DUF177 domain-containing protein [Anaeromicrobium sp.]
MKITLNELIEKRKESVDLDIIIPMSHIGMINKEIEILSPVSLKGKIFYEDDSIYLEAHIKTKAECICHRCLQKFQVDIENSIHEKLTINEEEMQDYYYIDKNSLDIAEIVDNALVLNMPMKLVCDENCQGLCLACGVNLNEEQCDCEEDQIDPRLAKLKDLLLND